MQYQDFTITINEPQGDGYPVSALADGIGRVATVLTHPDDELMTKLAALANLSPTADGETIVRRRSLIQLAGHRAGEDPPAIGLGPRPAGRARAAVTAVHRLA